MFLLKIIFFLIAFSSLSSHEVPLNIVIIGGGPAGLATALEAKSAGANVTIIEKREGYDRERFIFLLEPTLNFLDKWEVSIPNLIIFDGEKKTGLTNIKELETALFQRVKAFGIPKILGEFKELRDRKAIILQQNKIVELAYDLLVGADGPHSTTRDFLDVGTKKYGQAFGSISILPFPRSEKLEFILPFKHGAIFINKIVVPIGTIFAIQGKELSKEMICAALIDLGWTEEALSLSSNKGMYMDHIEVALQQSATFSNTKESAIILGDAAASASFLRGMGANCAIEEAMIAGHLFKTELNPSDFSAFNEAMQNITDKFIEDSAFLFNE